MKVNLSNNIAGVKLKNPVIVASGPHGRDGKTILEISKYGPAAVVTKTLVGPTPAPDPLPYMAKVGGGFLNCAMATTIPDEKWFKHEFKIAKQGKAKIIANVNGRSPQMNAELAKNSVNS